MRISSFILLACFLVPGNMVIGSNIKNGSEHASMESDNIPSYRKTKYRKDAIRLALRLKSTGDYHQLQATVPEKEYQSIYNALIAIHQSDLPEAVEVTRNHKLHTFPAPSIDRFFVVYKKTAPWATALRLGDNTTSSDEINALLEDYGLVIDRNVEWDEEHASFHVRAKEAFNIATVAHQFSKIENVTQVDLLLPNGDGNDIEIETKDNGWNIHYKVKFDSCITGCKKQHIWSFHVDEENEVLFLSEAGDPLPDWMR